LESSFHLNPWPILFSEGIFNNMCGDVFEALKQREHFRWKAAALKTIPGKWHYTSLIIIVAYLL